MTSLLAAAPVAAALAAAAALGLSWEELGREVLSRLDRIPTARVAR